MIPMSALPFSDLTSVAQFMSTVLMQYVHVLARVAIANNALFMELMALAGQTLNMPPTQVWEDVLNQWWSRVRMI